MKGIMVSVGIVLLAAGAIVLVGTGLQIAPTDTSVIVYSSGGGSTSANAWPITTNWEPSKATNLTGASFLLRLQTGKAARDVDITFLAVCGGKPIGSGSGRAYISATFAWYTVPTYEAAMGKVSGGFAKNQPCSMEIAISSPGYNIYEVFTPANGRKALTVWGYQASTPTPPPEGPGPGGPSTTGPTWDAGDGDVEPEPTGGPDVGRYALMALAIVLIVFGIALVGSEFLEFLG